MTEFERLAGELNVPITLDDTGFYTGICRKLAVICCDVIMTATSQTEDLHADIKARFYKQFPYWPK